MGIIITSSLSAFYARLFLVLACTTTTTILLRSDNNGALLTTAFRSSSNNFRHRSSASFLSLSSSSDDNGGLSELDLLQRSLYRKEFDNLGHKSTWLESMKELPFECTGCGNCCKTTGNVYMSPEEVSSAASYKNMTTSEFIDSYAGYTLETTSTSKAVSAGDGESPWILLQNQETKDGQGATACVFLDRESNQCGIYSVRPIQCSTYPFWSKILESEHNWNDEVRRKDNEDADEASASHNNLPTWTPEGGGCEGMKILDDVDTKMEESEGVPVDRALQQLSLYKRADRRLPREYNKIPLLND